MKIEIKEYKREHEEAVKRFNERLMTGGAPNRISESHAPPWLPRINGRKIYQECFLAFEDTAVHGGYILKHQLFHINGKDVHISDYQAPISEGVVNKEYNMVGLQILIDALRRQPLLFAYGMGGYSQPLPNILEKMGWSMFPVPFFFKINNVSDFLRNIVYLRTNKTRELIFDILAFTRLCSVPVKIVNYVLRNKRPDDIFCEKVNEFADWADRLWDICKDSYSMSAVRDRTTLNILYPKEEKRFIRLKVMQNDETIGWALVLDSQFSHHKQFGAMRVGSIVDCLALPENAFKVIYCATEFLEGLNVDIILSNQSHSAWCSGLKDTGFMRGPSNCIFAASKKLSRLLNPFDANKTGFHLNRGDGDGPIHL